jgi:hypothetical protein
MACTPCQQRRKALLEAKRKKKAEGKRLQASAIGAVLAVSAGVGAVFGLNGEDESDGSVQDGRDRQGDSGAA